MNNKKSSYLNKKRTAYKKVHEYLKFKFGIIPHSINIIDSIKIFAESESLKITGNPKKWLLNLYISGENDFIKRSEDGFYNTKEWRILRSNVLAFYGCKCMNCGSTNDIVVDHIRPRSKIEYKHLELEFGNMQVLCNICNLIKSNKKVIDYRVRGWSGLKDAQHHDTNELLWDSDKAQTPALRTEA